MSNIERVEPIVENGVEFYVSADGKQRGISQVGCAKLIGISEQGLRQFIKGLSDRSKTHSKSLEHLVGANLYLAVSSNQQARILDSKVVASIISYYAIERKNEVALYSLQKFASIGIDTWIDNVTGVTSIENSHALLESMNATLGKLLTKVTNLERIEEETASYRKAVVKLPLFEKWMSELDEEGKLKLLAPSEETYTIKEAVDLIFPGSTFPAKIYKQVALKVGQTISGLEGGLPLKKNTPNGKGYNQSVRAYTPAQLPLIKLSVMVAMGQDW